MRLYYIDESEGPRYYVRSALGVDGERWNDLFGDIHSWRLELQERYGIPLSRELTPPTCWRAGGCSPRTEPPANGCPWHREPKSFWRVCAARSMGGIEVINVCLHKPESRRYEQVSLDRLLNRINTSVTAAHRHAFLIFDEGKEQMITRLYGRLKVRNHVPSRYDIWEDGEKTRNTPIEHVIGGPAIRSSKGDHLLQMADLIAHALLKQEEAPIPRVENHGIAEAFSILDAALNRQASRRDPQGVVRR